MLEIERDTLLKIIEMEISRRPDIVDTMERLYSHGFVEGLRCAIDVCLNMGGSVE